MGVSVYLRVSITLLFLFELFRGLFCVRYRVQRDERGISGSGQGRHKTGRDRQAERIDRERPTGRDKTG